MLGRKKRLLARSSFALDATMGVVLLALCYLLIQVFGRQWQSLLQAITGYPFLIQSLEHLRDRTWIFLVIHFHLLAALYLDGYYSRHELDTPTPRLLWAAVRGVFLGTAVCALMFYFWQIADVNRSLVFGFGSFFLLYLFIKEPLWRRWLRNTYLPNHPLQVLLVASAHRPSAARTAFEAQHRWPARVVATVVDHPHPTTPESHPLSDLPKLLAAGGIEICYLDEHLAPETAHTALAHAEEQGCEVWLPAAVPKPQVATVEVDLLGSHPLVVYRTTQAYDARLLLKRVFDVSGAGLLLLLLSPLLLLIAVGIRLESRGPVFFLQQRTGRRGRPFRMVKFRTMRNGAEAEQASVGNEMQGPVFKNARDPRITGLGRWLRRHSFDELPQLFNVLAGHMSLVGPRPLPVYETAKFGDYRSHRRNSVLPGMTGLWQVSGRSELQDFADWVRLDLEYIDRWSLGLDLQILLRTIPVVLFGKGAR